MKYLVVSDIHGSVDAANMINDIVRLKDIDKIIILGDLYHTGLMGLANESVVDILNNMAGIIYAVRGNCDTDYDLKLSKFNIERTLILSIRDKLFMFNHGDSYDKCMIPSNIDYFVEGHTHQHRITKENGITILNPGSIAYPRGYAQKSYMIIDEDITIYNLEHEIIEHCDI